MIESISKVTSYFVELKEGYPRYYRTTDGSYWEAMYGESWETEYRPDPTIVNEFLAYLEMKKIADETAL